MKRSRDYRNGEAEGLRRAADLVRELERTVAERLDLPSGRVTREARKVRHKAFQVAAKRIETVLRKHTGSRGRYQVEAQLRRLGLD